MIVNANNHKTKEFGLLAFRKFAVPLMPLILILIWCSFALASTTGKIAGIVTNGETGEPLQGATIKIQGTQFAAEADSDGEFYVINLSVGLHTVSVSMLGYETMILKDIRVLMDLTTPLEFVLYPSPLDIGKSVTVVAQRPLILRDKTSSGAIVTRDEIAYMANARNITTVMSNMTGTVVDADSGLHVRGGRQGTVTYFFDGFSVQDPFNGGLGMRIVPEALEELSLTSGGLAPEYGEALSGVVNAITREGGEKFRGRVKMYEGVTHEYDVTRGKYRGLKRIDDRLVTIDLSGPLVRLGDRMTNFFGAVEYLNNDGYLPHSASKLFSGVGKVIMFPASSFRLTLNGSYYLRDRERYVHRDVNNMCYDFNLDGLGKIENEAYLVGVKGNYTKSAKTVISVSANRFRTSTRQAPEHLFDQHYTDWPGYSVDSLGNYNGIIDDSNYNRSMDYFGIGFTSGDDYYPYYLERIATYNGAQFSVLSQLDKFNQIKFGGDFRRYRLQWDNRQFFNEQPYGETYDFRPIFGAGFLQDKIELNDMVVNIGLRFDYFHGDAEYWHNPITKDYRKHTKAKVQWSPRLGISHPVSENAVMHFNYGYLFQPPNARLLYTNLNSRLDTGYPLIGNPDLDPEKTVYYELGWTQVINSGLRLNITTYYKDIKNMIGAREVVDEDLNHFTVFTNSDYGSSKGFDVALASINPGLFNWSVNYSYMIAKGNASDPFEWYYDYYTVEGDERPPLPSREYPLSFDQRHSLTAIADFRVAPGEKREILGVTIPDAWGVNLLGRYGSGLAFTKTSVVGHRMGTLNGERMPYTLRFDTRLNKNFYFSEGGSFISFFVEVENLFDRRNVVDVYTATGEPDDDAFVALNVNSPDYEQEKVLYELLSKDPQNYDHPRQVRVGMEFNF
jgi:outer membrane receptor protein involved in Fe transport